MNQPDIELTPTTVTANREIAKGVYVISYPREDVFVPGQVVAVALSPTDVPRIYSIASGMQEEDISILFDVKPEGTLTPKLARLKPGDTLYVSKPYGSFYGKAEPAYWIAAGTGIAPFVSMFRSGLGKNKTLIHGSRTLEGFFFQNEFLPAMGEHYVRCCSKEKGDGVYEGRLTKYLEEMEHLPDDRKYYLCGSAEMVVDVRDLLVEKGISFNNIIAEIYF